MYLLTSNKRSGHERAYLRKNVQAKALIVILKKNKGNAGDYKDGEASLMYSLTDYYIKRQLKS